MAWFEPAIALVAAAEAIAPMVTMDVERHAPRAAHSRYLDAESASQLSGDRLPSTG